MAYIRRLPSGKYQATVRRPDGTKITRSDPLRRVVATWAKQAEADIGRGQWRDPVRHAITLEQWWAQWSAGRIVEEETARGDQSMWRNHLGPQLGGMDLASLSRAGVQAWPTLSKDRVALQLAGAIALHLTRPRPAEAAE